MKLRQKVQLYNNRIIDKNVGKEKIFETDGKFLQGETSVPVEKDGEYFFRLTVFSGDDKIVKDVVCVTGILIGDADGNGLVEAWNARITLRIAAKLETADSFHLTACDMDSDNTITAKDARLILRLAAKLN